LILTDLNMPGMDGFTFASYLRNRGVDTPIIAVTAHASDRDQARSKEAGISTILIKPVLLEALRTTLAQIGNGVPATPRGQEQWDIATGVLPPEVHAPLLSSLEASVAAIQQLLQDKQAGSASQAEQQAFEPIGKHLHSLRGAFAFIHETVLAQKCAAMEQLLQEKNLSALQTALDEFDLAAHAALERRRLQSAPTTGPDQQRL
jgi:two-component system capsular synthesis sensor histidine kinase RcsC